MFMFRFRLSLFVFLAAVSCRPKLRVKAISDDFLHILHINQDAKVPDRDIDPSLAVFIPEFTKESAQRQHEVSSDEINKLRMFTYVDSFPDDVPPKVIGLCSHHTSYGKKNLKKTATKWLTIGLHKTKVQAYTKGDPLRLREVVFHELFHCFMDKGHLPEGVVGLMSPSLVKTQRIYKDWGGILDEAFSKKLMEMMPDSN